MTNSKIDKIISKQNVRLVDVFVVAPILIYSSTLKHSPNWIRASLLLIGIATLGYNGYHFLDEAKKKPEKPKE